MPDASTIIIVAVVIGVVGVLGLLIILAIRGSIREWRGRSTGFKEVAARTGGLVKGDRVNVFDPAVPYSYRFEKRTKNTPPVLHVTVPARLATKFRVRRSGWFDRLGVGLGLARKIVTGDEDFDRGYFIESPTPNATETLFAEDDRRRDARDILELGFTDINANGREVVARWVKRAPKGDDDAALLQQTALQLTRLARDGGPAADPDAGVAVESGQALRLVAVWMAVGLLMSATLVCWMLLTLGWPRDWWGLLQWSLAYSVPLWVTFVFLAALALRSRSTGHKEWLTLAVVSLVVFPLCGYHVAACLNSRLDDGPASVHDPVIAYKYVTHSRHSTSYHVDVEPWDGSTVRPSFNVTSAEYQAIQEHVWRMLVTTRPGWLGYEWIASYELQPRRRR